MIEASVLSPGSWNSDFTLAKDASVDFYRMDVDVGLNITSEEVESYHSVNGSSQSPSIASSECDDDFNIDVCSDDHSLFTWNDNDYMNSALNDVLQDNLPDQITLSSLDWSLCEDLPVSAVSEADSDVVVPSSPQPIRKRNKILDPFTSKSWSRLNMSEQVEVVEALTQVISSELGLREQLDVIRLIDPSAVVSTSDTEFVIDLNCLTDSKWQSVREYVKKARKNRNQVGEKTSAPSEKSNCFQKSRSNNENNSQHVQNSSSSTTSSNLINSKVKQSKKDNKEHKVQAKAWKQRQKKEYRQMMKERRSGLFVKEEVLALSVCPPPEEEDIDILD